MTDKDVRIGVVVAPEDRDESTAQITGGGTIAVYLMAMIPIGILAYALASRNNWTTDIALLFFAGMLLTFTLFYVFSTMGTLTKIIRMTYALIMNIYTVNRQHNAYLMYLEADKNNRSIEYARQIMHVEPRALIEDKSSVPLEAQIQIELLKYVTYLYQTQDGEYLHIQSDGRIKNAVPWSARKQKLDPDLVDRIINLVSWKAGKKLIYYNKHGWYLNVEDYPYHDEVVRMFNSTVAGDMKDEY